MAEAITRERSCGDKKDGLNMKTLRVVLGIILTEILLI
jgi:hypothetical protein